MLLVSLSVNRLLVVKFLVVKSYMQIFQLYGGILIPNPPVVQRSTVILMPKRHILG